MLPVDKFFFNCATTKVLPTIIFAFEGKKKKKKKNQKKPYFYENAKNLS